MKKILILEDDAERLEAFRAAVASLGRGVELVSWRDTATMAAECDAHLGDAHLISLDHELKVAGNADSVPGVEAAEFLAKYPPICPVILHAPNGERTWQMEYALQFAQWTTERIQPSGDWIQTEWLPRARGMVSKANSPAKWHKRPSDHAGRVARAELSLLGLSVGDAFGACFFGEQKAVEERLSKRRMPPPKWVNTADTMMTISIVEVLKRFGEINQDALARAFAEKYQRQPNRGYGAMACQVLQQIGQGKDWRKVARDVFGGMGSMGNGGAMRAAPIGAYYGDKVGDVIEQAARSAEVTHAHPEGQAGAVAAALAASWTTTHSRTRANPLDMLQFCEAFTPSGVTRAGIQKALSLSLEQPVRAAASTLGNGSAVISSDTIPFALWCAARHLHNFIEAMWTTVSGLGDRDTNCAIVGGIVAPSVGREGIPRDWLDAREPLPFQP
ncbi:MAG: ADP-ribosylglycohydrolase family protein [Verrucomicrobiota bacterium]